MARIHFNLAEVQAQVALVKAEGARIQPLYEEETGPGLWLVGDSGVYLMANAEREALKPGESYPVAYAAECPPDNYGAKRSIFGGDDGVEFLALADIETWIAAAVAIGDERLEMNITYSGLSLVSYARNPKAKLS